MKNTLSNEISLLQKDFQRHQERVGKLVKKGSSIRRKQSTVAKKVTKAQQLLREILS